MHRLGRALLPYCLTLIIVAGIVVLKRYLNAALQFESPLTLFYTAVILSAWVGGRTQGLFATITSIVFSYMFFIYPEPLFGVYDAYGPRLVLFAVDGVLVTFVCEAMRKSRVRAELALSAFRSAQSMSRESQTRHQFLDSVIENLPAMVFVKDAKTLRFVRFNRAGEELTGHTREDLIGKNDYDFFPKEQADFFVSKDRAVLEGRKVADIPEEEITTRFGIRYLHTRKIPIFDENGDAIYLLGISEDITEAKNAEQQRLRLIQEKTAREEAEKSAERLRFLSEASAALSESLDLKSRLDAFAHTVISNLADICEIVLVDDREQVVQEIVIAHRDPIRRQFAADLRDKMGIDWNNKSFGTAKVLSTGKPEIYPVMSPEVLAKSGLRPEIVSAVKTYGTHSIIVAPLQTYERMIGCITIANAENKHTFDELDLSLVMDLAKRASAAIENSRLYRQAQEASQAKSAFLANMSHEIRTPLGAMLGFAELLEDEKLSEAQKKYMQTLLRNGRQLLGIVDEILDLSKVESERISIENVKISPEDLIEEVISLLRLQAQAKGVELRLNYLQKLPKKVSIDPLRLRQILLNVIGNAIKFTPRGHVAVSVALHERPNQPNRSVLEVTVEDTGIGISREQRERLFQAFVQADDSTTRRFGGTGLGLFLARKLARLMGGDVVLAASEPQKGSKFVITTTVGVIQSTGTDKQDANSNSLTQVSRKGRILVVDDAPDNRVLIELLISRLGYPVDVAATGAEGVEKALTQDYALILMDVQMPEMDGFEAVNRLRAQNYFGPVVALTAHTMKGDRERCLAGGFDGYLGKPIDRAELKKILEQSIQRMPSTGASSDSSTHL